MSVSEIINGMVNVLQSMDNPNLIVRSVNATAGVVEFVNGVQYDLHTGQRIK